jgi:hypothetical protein
MSSNIIVNKSNIVNDGNNSLRYTFPSTVKFEEGDTLAISHLSIYYSWYNVSKKYNNTSFKYKWWDSDGNLTDIRTVDIPDGFYSISSLFEYFQKAMVLNNHYLLTDPSIGSDGSQFVYFMELLQNISYYSIEIRLSSLNADYITANNLQYPANAGWIAPQTYETPQLIIPSNNRFGELIGFKAQTIFKDMNEFGQYSFLSDFSPNMNPSSSFIITCSLIDNDMGNPNDILYSFTLNSADFGDMISSNTDVLYNKIKPGTYTDLKLNILDQDYIPLHILDPNILIVLSIMKQ